MLTVPARCRLRSPALHRAPSAPGTRSPGLSTRCHHPPPGDASLPFPLQSLPPHPRPGACPHCGVTSSPALAPRERAGCALALCLPEPRGQPPALGMGSDGGMKVQQRAVACTALDLGKGASEVGTYVSTKPGPRLSPRLRVAAGPLYPPRSDLLNADPTYAPSCQESPFASCTSSLWPAFPFPLGAS